MEITIVTLAEKIAALREKRAATLHEMTVILDTVRRSGATHLTAEQSSRYDALEKENAAAAEEIRAIEEDPASRVVDRDVRLLPGGEFVTEGRTVRREDVTLRYNERLADRVDKRGQDGSFGKWLKGTIMGDWRGAEEERVMSIGTPSAGGYLVPTPLAVGIIDLSRNQARVLEAGAQTVHMTAETLRIARQLTDPLATWRAENAAVTTSDLTFDSVTLTAHTLAVIVKFSRELFEDAPNLDQVVRNAMSKSIALEIDRVALYGSGVDPEPRGLINTSGVSVVSMGANGGPLTNYDVFIQAMLQVENANETPNAAIMTPRSAAALATLKDTQGRYLTPPTALADLKMLTTKQLPITRTQGTATNASDIFVGEWQELLIEMRTELGIQILSERYADFGQIALLAWMRADIAVARPGGFAIIEGVTP